MKKTLIPIICILMSVLLFAGCTSPSGGATPSGDASPSQEGSIPSDDGGNTDDGDDGNEGNLDADKPSRGEWNGNVYTNSYAGFTFTMPDGWVASTDDEIATMMGLSADMMSEGGLQLSDEMLKLQVINDAMITDPVSGTNVIINFENLGVVIGGSNITEDEYFEAMKTQLESAGVSGYTFGEPYEEKIGANTFKVLKAEVAEVGMSQYIHVRKSGSYMVNVIATVVGETDIATVMANFS